MGKNELTKNDIDKIEEIESIDYFDDNEIEEMIKKSYKREEYRKIIYKLQDIIFKMSVRIEDDRQRKCDYLNVSRQHENTIKELRESIDYIIKKYDVSEEDILKIKY